MSLREPTNYERALLDKLLEGVFPCRDELFEQVNNSLVTQIDEDGSLEFAVGTNVKADCQSRIPTEGQAEDVDGATIHILLHVVNHKVKELEIYKDDGSRIIRMPEPQDLRLFRPG